MELEILVVMRRFRKLYEAVSRSVCEAHGISQTELDILGFLSNHPTKDTARDVTEWRMLPKANVSQAVDTLMEKGLLSRRQDGDDRRRIHLCLTDKAKRLIPDIRASRKEMISIITDGFDESECIQYLALQKRIDQNIADYLEGKESHI